MFEANYLICFDCLLLVPGLMPLLVLKNKLKQDLKKEKIGDRKRRATPLDRSPVFGAQSGSGWGGKRTFSTIMWAQNATFLKSGKQDKWQQGSGNEKL